MAGGVGSPCGRRPRFRCGWRRRWGAPADRAAGSGRRWSLRQVRAPCWRLEQFLHGTIAYRKALTAATISNA